jgi:hypothetical protein
LELFVEHDGRIGCPLHGRAERVGSAVRRGPLRRASHPGFGRGDILTSAAFLPTFAEDLFDLELPASEADLRVRTATWVVERMAGAGQVTRAGLLLTATLIETAIRLRTGRSYAALAPARRRAVARGLAASRMPLVGDYVRVVRSLLISCFYEQRYPT